MNRFLSSCGFFFLLLIQTGWAGVTSLPDAIREKNVACSITAETADTLSFQVQNISGKELSVSIPAGLICVNDKQQPLVALQTTEFTVATGGTVDAKTPAAMLSTQSAFAAGSYELTSLKKEELQPLLEFLGKHQDTPKPTAQLAVLCFTENIGFAAWQHFLATNQASQAPPGTHPTPEEVTQAIDALGLIRTLAPNREFALGSDGELKLRGLRNPVCRAKAMQVFGMQLSDAQGSALPPELGQLLHTKPGDNCPICRQRARMQLDASGGL